MKRMRTGGGWAAIRYTLRMARRVGWWQLWKAMRTKNACKTCALGMGGQKGGMRNEVGQWPEVCKKSLQAMVADMQKGLRPEFFRRYSLDQLRTLSPRELEWCGRLVSPLYAGPRDTHFQPITWDDALERITQQFRNTAPNEHFFYASGRSSNEAGFLLQLFARMYGTNYVNNCSYYCHQASGVGLSGALGTGTATVTLEDVEKTQLFFLVGANPASNHPRLMRTLMNIRRRGGEVIVINPVKEVGLVNFSVPSDPWSLFFGSPIASLYVQPHIGGDIALFTGVAKVVLERNAHDKMFLAKATEGFEVFEAQVKSTPWEVIERSSGVERSLIERIASMYIQARSAVFAWAMGITHHAHGVGNVQTMVNLALLRGMVGRPHAGLLPIRGHSNVQGMGSMGVTPSLKQQVLDNLEKHLNVSLPRTPGLDTMGCMQASAEGRMRSAFCLGGNLFGSNPDSQFARRSLGALEQITYLNTTLNTGHVWGQARETILLPVLARDEEPQKTTQESMFNFVRLSDGGRARLEGPRSEVDIISTLGQRIFVDSSPVDWKQLGEHCHLRQMIAQIIPGFEQIKELDRSGEEFTIGGRIFHTPQNWRAGRPKFATPTGQAAFKIHLVPDERAEAKENELRLMTVRSEGQFNTVVYEEEDIYRSQDRRNVILLHRDDIERLGLRINQSVTVRSSTGNLPGILVRAFDIRPGNALMYFPEANVLVPRTTDPASKTPAFKSVWVTLEPESPLAQLGIRTNRRQAEGSRE